MPPWDCPGGVAGGHPYRPASAAAALHHRDSLPQDLLGLHTCISPDRCGADPVPAHASGLHALPEYNWFVCATATTFYGKQLEQRVLAEDWQDFAGQPFYDQKGNFISALNVAPMMCITIVSWVDLRIVMGDDSAVVSGF